MVVNSNGVPPAAATPSFAASAWGRSDSEQGVFSPWVLMTPTKGFAIAASSRPRARMNVRCDVRSRPSSVRRERLGAGDRSLMASSCAPTRCAHQAAVEASARGARSPPRSAVSSGPGGRTHHGSQASWSSGQAQGRPAPDHGHVAVRRRHRAARPLARRFRAQPPRPRQDSRHRRRRGARAARRGRRRDRARPHAPRGAAAHRGRLRRGRRRGEERGRAPALSALGGPRAPRRRGGGRRHRGLARGRGRRRRRGGRRLGAAARGDRRGRRHGRRRAAALRRRRRRTSSTRRPSRRATPTPPSPRRIAW